jgi:hypothetical protein
MKPTKNGIILKVDPQQKERAMLGDAEIMIGVKYKTNHRDKHPVIGVVEAGNEFIPAGMVLVVHHNFLYGDTSVFSMGDGLFSIPTNQNIFMRIDEDGEPHSMFGNIICEWLEEYSPIEKPREYTKKYHDRARVLRSGFGYKKGQIVFTVPYAPYEIIYNFGKKEHRVLKIYKDDICAVLQ